MPRFVNFVSNAIQSNLTQQTGGTSRAGRSSSRSDDRGGGGAGDFAGMLDSARHKPEPAKAEAKRTDASAAAEKKPVRAKKADRAEKSRDEESEAVAGEPPMGAAEAVAAQAPPPPPLDSGPVDADADEEAGGDALGDSAAGEHDELDAADADALLAAMSGPAGVAAEGAGVVDAELADTDAVAQVAPEARKVVATPVNPTAATDPVDAENAAAAGEAAAETTEDGETTLPKGFALHADDATGDESLPESTTQTEVALKAVENAGGAKSSLTKDAGASGTGIFADAEAADAITETDGDAVAADDAATPADAVDPNPVAADLPDGATTSAAPTASAPAATPSAAGAATELSAATPAAPTNQPSSAHQASAPTAPTPPPTPQDFADANHAKIVTGVRGELMPNGGSMQIRLTPDNLGPLDVSIRMQDGVMTASFQTSNDEATRLLSHSLGQLKHALESQGVTVDRLQVQQAPRDQNAANDGSNDGSRQQQRQEQYEDARQEQQRKELLRRMWDRLAGGSDPLDLVA